MTWGRLRPPDPWWTTHEVAEYLGVKPATVSAYKNRGQMPAPDGQIGRTPWWWSSTIRKWRPQP